MLENYFPSGIGAQAVTQAQKQRVIAVQAALELVKASLSSAGGQATSAKFEQELKAAIGLIEPLADAIQKAISKE
ncbi:hypothetical protein ACR22U_004945 [Escherichia coli]|uniref:hypothetical protein n=1 Tax=Escherichia coli TaxID=562 RepID=UPI0002878161|nr:hypothetical protein [Escherichia coli]EBQ1658012.1 hypothetical protein [Salmonella enterica]ECJ4606357.1 hypothetical protein [Salmonella enterica subsp. enterica serovar Telhashomer]ASO83992.1 hypothetical protein AKN41_2373 [Escherichia coli]EBQ1829881.1 hypothetical protein [Salmonella enterica]EDP9274990.1 hypothetical protein [Salmonella enterica subsp. enterica serovar Telhashomer]